MNLSLNQNQNIIIGRTNISQNINGVPVINGGNNNIEVNGLAIVNGKFIDGTKEKVCIKTFEENFDVKDVMISVCVKVLNTTNVIVRKGDTDTLTFKYYGTYNSKNFPYINKIISNDWVRIIVGVKNDKASVLNGTLEITIPYELEQLDIFTVFGDLDIKDDISIKNLKVTSEYGNISISTKSNSVKAKTISGNLTLYTTASKIEAKSTSGDIEVMPVGDLSISIFAENNTGDTGISCSYNKNGFSNIKQEITQFSSVSKVKNRAVINTDSNLSLKITCSTVSGNVYID